MENSKGTPFKFIKKLCQKRLFSFGSADFEAVDKEILY